MAKKVLRAWRISEADPSGSFVWFDPSREFVEIHDLEPPKDSGVVAFDEGDDQRSLFGCSESSSTDPHPCGDDLPF